MSKTIYKYEVKVAGSQTVQVPLGAEILNMAEQRVSPAKVIIYMWCLVDPEEQDYEEIYLEMFGTGGKIDNPDNLEYIQTVHASSGHVWHFFKG